MREDLNEAGVLAGVRLAVNVAPSAKEPAALFVGDPPTVLRHAAKETSRLYGHELKQRFDIVVASCGGAPKDICLYQAQKALDAARHCAAPTAKFCWWPQCAQGIGDERYEEYVCRFSQSAGFDAGLCAT